MARMRDAVYAMLHPLGGLCDNIAAEIFRLPQQSAGRLHIFYGRHLLLRDNSVRDRRTARERLLHDARRHIRHGNYDIADTQPCTVRNVDTCHRNYRCRSLSASVFQTRSTAKSSDNLRHYRADISHRHVSYAAAARRYNPPCRIRSFRCSHERLPR